MLKISSDQMKAFQPDAETAFVRRVMDYLKENHADTLVILPHDKSPIGELSDEILEKLVQDGIKRGGDYGIAWRSTLLSFVVLLFTTAPNFDEHPKPQSFFSEHKTIEDNDLESLMEQMTDEDWESVTANYDAGKWNLPIQKGANV
jgi:hypothetical protein